MTNKLIHSIYLTRITKSKTGGITFLIDQETGAIFSESETGVITFQNADGDKWVFSENSIDLEKDLAHFLKYTDNGATCINGMFGMFESKEDIINKAYAYFSQFIIEEHPLTNKNKWTIFLN